MKIYISADIEGITGVTHWDETDLNKPDCITVRVKPLSNRKLELKFHSGIRMAGPFIDKGISIAGAWTDWSLAECMRSSSPGRLVK